MVGKDLIMATLFGSGGGSSGSGGGSAGVSPKEVNFYDYDGTCVHAYTVAEAQALSELPAGPEHPGLVFQGWNWSLEGVKGLTRAMNIGAMYTTDDGTTRLYITLQEGRTSPMLGVGVNGTVTVDWGDGTEPNVLTGTDISTTKWTPEHAYAAPGDYVIRLTVDGEMGLLGMTGTGGSCVLRHSESSDNRNKNYLYAVRKAEIGANVQLEGVAFHSCISLASVSIPANVVLQGAYTFYGCTGLKYITVPTGETVMATMSNQFANCYGLSFVSYPERGVTSYRNSVFSSCSSFASVIVPAQVISIEARSFYGCNGVAFYDFTAHTAVPSLANTNAFTGIPADCEIRVPAALYDEWIAATNWATYADYIKAY